jgi:hypothetical protein
MNRERIEEWWPLAARIIGFFVGTGILIQQALVPNPPGAQESLIAVAIGLMGPFAASLFAGTVEKARPKDREDA